MIDKQYGKYVGWCDNCGADAGDKGEQEQFDTWEECRDWLKENWHIKFNYYTQEYEHYCNRCKEALNEW